MGTEIQEMQLPDTPYGCNMAFRRHLVLELGGFSPDGMGGALIEWRRGDGETGFAYKVYAQKYKIIYTPKGWLYHCIPVKRMTLAAVRHRTMKDAITPCYIEMRTHDYCKRILIIKALKNICKSLIYFFKRWIYCFYPVKDWIGYELCAIRYGIMFLYQLRLVVDKNLLNWVYQDNYWN